MDIQYALFCEAVEARVKNLFSRFEEIKKDIIERNGGAFTEAINRIATQKNWKRKDKSDVYGDNSDVNLWNGFEGTDEGVVFRNFMRYMRLYQSDDQLVWDIDLFVLRKAIEQEEELKAFVLAIISAVKVVEAVKLEDYNDCVDEKLRNNLDTGRNPARHPEYFQSHHMEEKIFPVEKITCREDFVTTLNKYGVGLLLKRLSGGKIRFGNQYFQVEGPDLIRHYLDKFGLWDREGIAPERSRELNEFCSRKK